MSGTLSTSSNSTSTTAPITYTATKTQKHVVTQRPCTVLATISCPMSFARKTTGNVALAAKITRENTASHRNAHAQRVTSRRQHRKMAKTRALATRRLTHLSNTASRGPACNNTTQNARERRSLHYHARKLRRSEPGTGTQRPKTSVGTAPNQAQDIARPKRLHPEIDDHHGDHARMRAHTTKITHERTAEDGRLEGSTARKCAKCVHCSRQAVNRFWQGSVGRGRPKI
jgi:hypothetical protein